MATARSEAALLTPDDRVAAVDRAPGPGAGPAQASAAAAPDRNAALEALLARLVEQQTAQLTAYAEGLRLQRVLVEHLLGAGSPLAVLTGAVAAPAPSGGAMHPAPSPAPAAHAPERPEPVRVPAPGPVGGPATATGDGSSQDEPPLLEAPPADEPDYTALNHDVRRPGSDGEAAIREGAAPPGKPGWRVIRGGAGAPPAAPVRGAAAATPVPVARVAGAVDTPELARLKRFQAAQASGVPNLVLTYGPHQGKTLHQLAQEAPDALKALAVDAHTPEVRLGARRMIEYLGLNRLRPSGRTRRPSTRRL